MNLENKFQEALTKHPFLYKDVSRYSKRQLVKYSKALEKYPDLIELCEKVSMKCALLAYDFREELLRKYHGEHTSELANARCDIQLSRYSNVKLPEDLPSISFERECIICAEEKKGLYMCQDCWQKIRRALEIKAEKHREGWTAWGYEWPLDLSKVIELLAIDKKENSPQE